MPDSLAAALAELQQHLPDIPKTQTAEIVKDGRPQYTYKYADLADVSAALLPVMAALGLSWTCRPTLMPGTSALIVLHYRLEHAPSGENLEGFYPLPASGSPQQIGSAITYARRYSLCAVTGLAPHGDDDDGAAAEKYAQDDAQRHADGRMTHAERQDHQALRQHDPVDPAKRQRDRPAAPQDDQWTMSPEDRPGSVTPNQLQRLGIYYTEIGVTERDDRLADMRNRTGRDITSSKDLSYTEAQAAIADLEPIVNAGRDKK